MAYIELEELKEILPDIFNAWMDGNDESWEWIFQEIEQKCHIGKPGKSKKKKKNNELVKRIDMLSNKLSNLSASYIDFEKRVNGKVIDLNTEVENMHRKQIDINQQVRLSLNDMGSEIRHIREDVKSTKSMAEIVKNRTDVDYTGYTKGYEDQIIQNVYNRMANRGATKEELDGFRNVIKKYNATETLSYIKPNKFVYADGKTAEEVKEIIDGFKTKSCKTCKYYTDREAGHGMHNSELDCYSIIGPCTNYSKWEAKDNG